jgi:hypothetical protein
MNRLSSMKNQKINHQNGVPAVQPAECGATARVVYFTRRDRMREAIVP